MPAKIDIDALKIFTKSKMRLNIGKKLKTASLNSRFTGSKKKDYTSTGSLLKNFETDQDLKLLLTYEFTHQQPQGRFTPFKKIIVWKKLFLFHFDPKV